MKSTKIPDTAPATHKICQKRICRLCTKNYPNELQSFFSIFNDVTLDSMLLSICFSQIQVSAEDGLPQGVCPTCITALVQAYDFQKQCFRSHSELVKLFADIENVCCGDTVPEISSALTVHSNHGDDPRSNSDTQMDFFQNLPEVLLGEPTVNSVIVDNEDDHKEDYSMQTSTEDVAVNSNADLDGDDNVESGLNDSNVDDDDDDYRHEFEMNDINTSLKCIIKEVSDDHVMAPEQFNLEEQDNFTTQENPLENEPTKRTRSSTRKALNNQTETRSAVSKEDNGKIQTITKKRFPCKICGSRFDKPSRVKRHMAVHMRIKPVPKVCTICDKTFPRESAYTRHMNVHNPEGRPFECDVCKQRFACENNLKRHEIVHSGILETSVKTTDVKRSFDCPECGRQFEKQVSLASHMRLHKADENDINPKIFKCNYCPKAFYKRNQLTRHSKIHQELKVHECGICQKRFALGSHLIDHMNLHKGLKPHVCPICEKAFQQSCTLKDHMRIHSGETPFLCSECGKAFNNCSNMRQHMLRHTGEKPFECTECPSKFNCRAGLRSHMQTHTGVKPYACDICDSSFTKPYSLVKHKRIHTGERPYPCDICDSRFNSSDHLKRHKRTHTGEKPYKCKLCTRAFSQSNDLVKHMRSHLGAKTYQCEHCPAAFRLHGELRTHATIHYDKMSRQYLNSEGDENKLNLNDYSEGCVVMGLEVDKRDELCETTKVEPET